MKKQSGLLAVLGAGILWGAVGFFRRRLGAFGFSAMQIVAVRATVTFCVLALFALITNRKSFRIRLHDCWVFLCMGIISILLFNWCYFTCMEYSSLAVAAVLMYTSPVFATLLSALFFGERITLRKLLAICAAFAGSVITTGIWESGAHITPRILGIGLLSGLCYASYSVFGHFALKRYSATTVNLYTFLFAVIGAWILAGPSEMPALLCNTAALPYAVGIGALTAAIPYMLFAYGLSRMDIGKANVLVTIELVSVALISLFLFSEPLHWYGVVGILLVMVAVALISIPRKAG